MSTMTDDVSAVKKGETSQERRREMGRLVGDLRKVERALNGGGPKSSA